jgi:hypothetical protein
VHPNSTFSISYSPLAPNPTATNHNIIIPKRIHRIPITLPPKIHTCNIRRIRLTRPLIIIRIRDRQAHNRAIIQPGLDDSAGAEMVLETLPAAGGEGFRGGDALGGEVGEGRVVGFPVVHEDLGLAADAEVVARGLGGVGHGDEGDVVGG